MCIRLLVRLMAVQVWLIYSIELQGKRKSDKTEPTILTGAM